MTRKFFPGCKVKARYPEASEWIARQVMERGYADEIVGCCRTDHQALTPNDTAVCICNNCMAMIDEDAKNGSLENIWVIIDNDTEFPLPDYSGRVMGIQDCGRAYDRTETQDAVRSLMRKMGIEVVELPDTREKSVFCGQSFCNDAPEQDASFAPWRYGADAKKRGIFSGDDADVIQTKMEKHAAQIPTKEVCCYCTACDAGLEAGGKDAVNILELVSGKFRN
ncbi:MAG: hypothetical protein Q4C41_05115 [Eggerthellaceae bacterium]|nr:hypothetical protein [Eggerthellaceae bacterium]